MASVQKVETGARQVDIAGTSMTGIVEQVKRVSDLIAEISHGAAAESLKTQAARLAEAVRVLRLAA